MIAVATLVAPVTAASPALAAPADAPLEAPAPAYLDQLLREINARRAKIGSPPLQYAGEDQNRAVSQYLADLTPLMQAIEAQLRKLGS